MTQDASRIINGSYGAIFVNGTKMASFTACEIKIELDQKEVTLVGDNLTRHKLVGKKISGNITGYKIDNALQVVVNALPTMNFILVTTTNDPEGHGKETVTAPNVKFTNIPINNWKAGELIEDKWDFVVDGEIEITPVVAA
jgi:hypothetical protein